MSMDASIAEVENRLAASMQYRDPLEAGLEIRVSYEVQVRCVVWGAPDLVVSVPFVLGDPAPDYGVCRPSKRDNHVNMSALRMPSIVGEEEGKAPTP